jgi:hypothetical protein
MHNYAATIKTLVLMKLLTEHIGSLLHATSIAWTNSCGGCIVTVPSLTVVRLAGDDTAMTTFFVNFIYFQTYYYRT